MESHAFLFEGGDVEGRVKGEVLKEWGIKVPEGGGDGDEDGGMEGTVAWAVGEVLGLVERLGGSGDS